MTRDFRTVLKTKDFIVTAQARPIKGADTTKMLEYIELLKDKVDALNLTDNEGSVMCYSSLGACLLAREHGGEAILEMTCRDRNRLAIQSDLLFAYSRGISNVLCLTGDLVDVGDHKETKPVFDLDSVQLIHLVHTLNSGKDMAGNELDGSVNFCIGASAAPLADPIEPQLIKFKKKLDAGVDFIQTQAVYDIDGFKRFMEHARKMGAKVKVLAGIGLLAGAEMAKSMNESASGAFVPQPIIDELAQTPKAKELSKGIEIAARLIRQIRKEKVCDGVHIMTGGREKVIPEILQAAGL